METNFFEWWEIFTEIAYERNLSIIESKDNIRDFWDEFDDDDPSTIEIAIEKFTR